MKSKKKQINKYKINYNGSDEDLKRDEESKRTSGTKPFQLNKLRATKRSGFDIPIKTQSINIIHIQPLKKKWIQQTYSLQNQNDEKPLSILVLKKQLIEPFQPIKLDSDRRAIVYQEDQNKIHKQFIKYSSDPENIKQLLINNKNNQKTEIILHQKEEAFSMQQKNQVLTKIHTKYQCCQNKKMIINALINNKNQTNLLQNNQEKENENENEQKTSNGHQNVEDKNNIAYLNTNEGPFNDKNESNFHLATTKNAPFTFTTLKWRSKSEVLIDKWKQKYKNVQQSELKTKLHQKNKSKELRKKDQERNYKSNENIQISMKRNKYLLSNHDISSQRNKIMYLPTILKKQNDQTPRDQQNKKNLLDTYQNINLRQPKQNQVNRQESIIQKDILKNKEKKKRRKSKDKTKKRKSQENKNQKQSNNKIIIRKMYNQQNQDYLTSNIDQFINIQLEKEKRNLQEIKKKKKGGSKFPSIHITTFYGTKSQQQIKKSKQQLIDIAKPWRQKQKKRQQLEKVIEEIPERWQYGESRQDSRIQVDSYIQKKMIEEATRMSEINIQKNCNVQNS